MADEKYMRRALQLAKLGAGRVSPNPMVGCVIVHDDTIIGEGYHQQYGEAHAEVNAVSSVKDASLFPESTVYVTLEPCAHFGKTPPCADLLVSKKVKKVVIAIQDPFMKVNGAGIKKLKNGGVEVEVGMLSQEAREQNIRFFTYHQKKRPFVILKWAQTADGFIARENYDSKWISNQYSRQLVHKWRTEEDAILVGKNTAIYDNPKLTARSWEGQNPIRIVIDRKLELEKSVHLFNDKAKTLIFNQKTEKTRNNLHYIQYDGTTEDILKKLYEQKIQSVIVEGGAMTLDSFIKENLWDEARVFSCKTTFGSGIKAPTITGQTQRIVQITEEN